MTAKNKALLGVVTAKSGRLKQGRILLTEALSEFQKLKSKSGQQETYEKQGGIQQIHHKHFDAIKYYKIAEAISDTTNSMAGYLVLQQKIGNAYVHLGQHSQALTYFKKGLARSGNGSPEQRVSLLQSAAQMLDTLGNKQQAIAYQQQGLAQLKLMQGSAGLQAQLLVGLSRTIQDQDARQGLIHLRNALDIANGSGNSTLVAEIHHSLHVLYKQGQQYQQALVSLEKFHILSDSLLRANKEHQLDVLRRSYQLLESRAQVEGLQLENQKKTSERNFYLFLVLFAVLLLVVESLYLFKVKDLNRKLAASNSVKDKLFSIIGHDLRNPVGGISQMLAFMEDGEIAPDEQKPMLTEMRKQGEAALEILNSLLQWGRAQMNGIQVHASEFRPAEIVEKNLEVLGNQISDKSINIQKALAPDLTISGDQNHFDFIIRNLLSNAIKFSPVGGSIEIGAKVKSQTGKVIFFVKDYGKGISKDQQKKFLNSNLDIAYGTKGEKGTGIGLALSKEFVQANHGKIWLESAEAEGTTFYFYF